ncbi:MAG: hypothetical protein IRY87_14485 [Acetobacteraceae bacterium]|nr:hypothetical protein [Acetobacteraceae bacterium]
MRKTLILSTALGAVMLLGGPAFAQSGRSIPTDPVAPLGAQKYAAHRAGDMGHRSSEQLLRESDRAVAAGNWARANELLERAQTAALNEQAMGGGAPQGGEIGLAGFAEARQAMKRRNRNEAHRALQEAMASAGRMDGNMATGNTGRTMPMHGGGYSGMQGGSYGTPAQAQGGMGTAGPSPYGSAQGTETMPNRVQPGTSALGNVQGQVSGPRGAPAPGQPGPAMGGSSSQLSTGGQVRPGSPTTGGGTGGSQSGSQGP